ncbi:MAG TPA: hypothetical protein ENJ55_07270 [Rhizobiales bacterium]|nr:hypothetical protein [Hyphomicrobiales bacterium]
MKHSYPSPRTLFIVWLTLMAATVMTMIAGKVTDLSSIGMMWAAILLSVTWIKARLILSYYLDLKSATKGWYSVFTVLVSFIIITVFVIYAGSKLIS